jgi:hypothetical protein
MSSRDQQIANQNTTISKSLGLSREQIVSITDLISEGPIEGLVNGESSIYLNDDKVVSREVSSGSSASFSGTITVTNGSTTATLPEPLPISVGAFRFVILRNVYSRAVTLGSIAAPTNGSTTSTVGITTSTGFFQTFMGTNNPTTGQLVRLKITQTGDILPGYLKINSSTSAVFSPSIQDGTVLDSFIQKASGNTVTIFVDRALFANSFSGNTITFAGAIDVPSGTYQYDFSNNIIIPGAPSLGALTVPSGNLLNQTKYEGVTTQFRNGELIQEPMVNYGGVSATIIPSPSFNAQPLEFTDGKSETPTATTFYPVTITSGINPSGFGLTAAQAREVDELRLIFSYNSLYQISTSDGDRKYTSAFYKIELRLTRGVESETITLVERREHNAKSTSPIIFEEIINLEPFKPFTSFAVIVTRLTRQDGTGVQPNTGLDEGTPKRQMNGIASISSVSSIIKENLSYPYSAYANVTFSSKEFSSEPTRTYHCRGLRVLVPSNYTTREENGTNQATYSGLWNGSFKAEKVYTDNPAWVYYDIISNDRYGLGAWVDALDINKYALYRIAKYCDELVPDGKGGFEPRFRANIYLTKAADAYKVLKDMATVFVGMLYWIDGQITTVIDQPKDSIYNFSKSNVIDGAFSYESSGTKTRTNQVIVSWNNPANNYNLESLIVEDKVNIVRSGRIITEDAVAFGCTSEGQATRYGRWKLWTAANQTELVSFRTSVDAGFLVPGDIVTIQDADRYQVMYSGRISSTGTLNGTTIPLDRAITLNAGSTYTLSVLVEGDDTEDGGDDIPKSTEVITATVSNVPGTTNTLTLSSTLSALPTRSSIWALREVESAGAVVASSAKAYRILSISEEGPFEFAITAVEHYNEKFDAIENDFTLYQQDVVYPPLTADDDIPAPEEVYVLQTPRFDREGEEFEIIWSPPKNPDGSLYREVSGYEITHNIPNYPALISVGAQEKILRFEGVSDGDFRIGVRTVNTIDNRSLYTFTEFKVDDPFGENVPRGPGGIAQGAISNATGFIDAGNFYRLGAENYALAPIQTPFNPFINTSSDPATYSQDISGISDTIIDNTSPVTSLISSYFIYFDRNNADKLKLIGWDVFTFRNLYYWYDAGNGSQNPTFQSLAGGGTSSIALGSNRVVGTGTSFLTDLDVGDVVRIATGIGAKVVAIVSDTLLILDRSFTVAYSGISLQTTTMQIDYRTDCIIARVYWDGTNYFYDNYLTLEPNLDQLARYVNVDSNIQFINYSAEETQETTYTDITLNITAFGFTTPEFKVTGLGFAEVTGTEDADYQPATSPNTYVRLINDATAVAYNAGAVLDFLVEVREANDPTNTNKQRSTTFRIGKVIGGSIGQDAKTVQLTATDYSIVYDQDGLTPSFEGTGGNITLTATAQGFVNPVYKFTGDGIVDDTVYGASNTKNFTVPASFFSSPQVLRVSVAESGVGTEEAFDNISIFAVKPGSDAYTVILTNEAHTLPANDSGVVTSFAGSGSLIEVFKGGTQLQFITSGTPTLGQFSVLVSSNTGMSAPSITVSGLNASIADFTSMVDDTEIVTYTINAENISTNIQKVQSFSKSKAGVDGPPGTKTALVYAYQRSATALTSDAGNVTVSLDTGLITTVTLANGWSKTIPSGTNPLYVIAASANGTGATDTILAAEWSDPVVLSQNGDDGLNTATVFIYQRTVTSSAPASLPTGNTTYTFATGAATFTTANGWTRTIPSSGGAYLWVSQATAAATTATDTIAQGEWSTAVLLSQDGAEGPPGTKTALVYAYQRSATALTSDAGNVTVSLDTGLITTVTLANGWSKTIPSGTNPLYVIAASANGTGATDTILAAEWSDPVVLSQNGDDGLNTATVFIYQRTVTSSAPASLPTGNTTYTFATGAATFTTANGWTRTIPSSGGAYLWVSQATAAATTATDTIAQGEWSTAVLLSQDGAEGPPGTKTALVYAYQRSATALTSDAGNVTVSLDTGLITTVTLANGWSKTIPSGTNPLYVIAASANGTGATDTILAAEWSDPVVLSQNGDDGLNTATVFIYQRTVTSSAPASLPTGNTTYTFATGAATFTTANGWTRTIPSSGGAYLWVSQATAAATTATDTIAQGEWSTAVLLSQDGAEGPPGTKTALVYAYQRSVYSSIIESGR